MRTEIPTVDAICHDLVAEFSADWTLERDGSTAVLRGRGSVRVTPRFGGSLVDVARVFSRRLGRPQVPLPVVWGRETDAVSSAVQALDPFLKNGSSHVLREGVLHQPVVRLTARSDADGMPADGHLTGFVNSSHVSRIGPGVRYPRLIQAFIDVLLDLGIAPTSIAVVVPEATWERGPVRGRTCRVLVDGAEIGDAVLMSTARREGELAIDIGSGLERLSWTASGGPWRRSVFGDVEGSIDSRTLDAIRTATLLVGCGVSPGSRGVPGTVRSLLRRVDTDHLRGGVGRLVRPFHAAWHPFFPRISNWARCATVMERELFR